MTRAADLEARERAITETGTNVVVTAGAGTGKTSLLVERALYLILGRGIAAERVAAITFTEKAAAELKRRMAAALTETLAALERSVPPENGEAERTLDRLRTLGHGDAAIRERVRAALDVLDSAFIGTLHALAADMLRRHALAANLPPEFEVADELSGGSLFDEAWSRFLSEELGNVPSRRELWTRVLERFLEEEIEEAARCLHAYPAAADLLATEGYRPLVPDSDLNQQARELHRRIGAYLDRMKAVPPPKKNKNFPLLLDVLFRLLGAYLAGGADTLDDIDVSTVDDFWEKRRTFKAGTPDAEEMESTAGEAWKLLMQLHKVDEAAIQDLMEALRPFARQLRDHVRREGVLTFDDLLLLARDLLRDVPQARLEERLRFDAVLVDEFQDTDPIQYEIVFFLCSAAAPEVRDPYALDLEPGRLFIVGDPKQSIYRFRGADMAAYHRATGHVRKSGTGLSLVTSYRSRPQVLAPLNRMFGEWIGAIPDRSIEPEYQDIVPSREREELGPGMEIWSIPSPDDAPVGVRRRAEAREIAARIREWLDDGRRARDIAVVFRALPDAPLYMRALREAGIDFVMDGGRAFFERPEIVEAFALLGTIANTADPVALIGVLRSGFGGASDQELVAHVSTGGTWRWTAPQRDIHDTFARLRELDATRRTMPLDRWIQWALLESPFALAQIAHVDGPQRIANLRKLAAKTGTLVRDRGLTLEEALRVLSEAFAGERVEGESPLADEALDAVRLTTIHKAKGLEFPIVIVPDVARRSPPMPMGTRVAPFQHEGHSFLAVEIADRERTRNLSEVCRAEEQRAHEEAEAKRLLYVATTRARDRIILVNSAVGSRVMWMAGLAFVGYTAKDSFPEEGTLVDGNVIHRVCVALRATPAPRALPSSDPPVDAYRAFLRAAEAAVVQEPIRFRNPSLHHLLAATDKDEHEDPGLEARRPDLARAVGIVVHRILERWNFALADEWRERLLPVVTRTAHELGFEQRDLLHEEARKILEGFARSPLRSYLAGVTLLGREVPILDRDPGGTTVVGYADLIYETEGRVHVADYKTDTDTSQSHAAEHRIQLADYARPVQEALVLSTPPITEILFIRAGTRIQV